MKKTLLNSIAILALTFGLSACSNTLDRLSAIGQEPEFKPVETKKDTEAFNYVSVPMPEPKVKEKQVANSLWQSDRKGFFKDQRARAVGDILTVIVAIQDEAEISNETERTRSSSESDDFNTLLGAESYLSQVLNDSVTPGNIVSYGGTTNNTGTGEIKREEDITTRVAAIVSQILPNGNMVISGHQEVRVNFEVRELKIAGVIRPEDIAPNNTINSDQIAEARISYGGRGQISDVQQPRYGSQVFDIIYPF